MKRRLFFGILFSCPLVAQSVPIAVEPAHQEVAVGDTFSVALTVAGVSDLKGANLRLSYESDIIRPISIEIGEEIHLFTEYISSIDSLGCSNIIEYMAVLSSTGAGVDIDSGAICLITFIALSETNFSPLAFDSIIAPVGNSESAVIPFTFNDGGVKICGSVGIAIDQTQNSLPSALILFQNSPNPFTSSTVIRYGIPEDSHVVINIYNIAGQVVKSLVAGNIKAGYYDIVMERGGLGSGIYFCKITTEQDVSIRKLILLSH